MAIYQPINVTPDLIGGIENGVVFSNESEGQTISWDVNGTSPLVAYQIDFYKNDAQSTAGDSTGKIVLDEPFYPFSGGGTHNRFSANVQNYLFRSVGPLHPVTGVWTGETFTGKFKITQWWGESDAESVTQYCASVYKMARNKSTSTISTSASAAGGYIATATFSNASRGETPVLEWTRFYAASTETGDIVQDTGKVWGASNLEWETALFAPGIYVITFEGMTNFGEALKEQTEDFTITDTTYFATPPTVQCDRARKAVRIGIDTVSVSYPEIGSATTSGGGTVIPSGESVGPIVLPTLSSVDRDKWGFVWVGTYPNGGGKLFSIFGSNGEDFTATWDETHNQVRVKVASVGTSVWGSVAADKNLIELSYNSGTWTMIMGRWNSGTYTASNPGTLPDFTLANPASVTFFGGTTVYDFAISWPGSDGRPSGFPDYAQSGEPQYTPFQYARYIADPDLSKYERAPAFVSYNYGTGEISLWRTNNSQKTTFIASMDASDPFGYVYDYSAPSQTQSRYFVCSIDYATGLANISEIAAVTPCWWEWTLIKAVKHLGADGTTFRVTQSFDFGCNLTSGDNANGNAPNVLPTFTPYPTVLRDTQNRQSGVLTSLLGSITAPGEYTDSNSLRDAVRALSVSTETLFLRNRRGDFLRIALSGPISTNTQDNSKKQILSVSLPWVEIGPVDAAVISIVPGAAQGVSGA